MKNPIIPGNHADPFVYRDGNDYYMLQTTEGIGWEGSTFHCYHSTDPETWSQPAEIFELKTDVSLANSCAWTPSLVKKDGSFYLAYHRFALPRDGYRREVCCDKVEFEDDLHLFVTPTR